MAGADLGPSYRRALAAFDRNDWAQAFALASPLAAHAPAHGEVQFIAGVAALQLSRLPAATQLLHRAVACEPGRADYRAQLARALVMQHRMQEALQEADAVARLAPPDASTWSTLGAVYSKAQAHDRASAAFRNAAALAPSNSGYRFDLATSLMYDGALEAAEREFETCIALDPRNWRAYLALANARRQTPERNHVTSLRNRLSRHPLPADAVAHLNLALAKELEDLGQFEEALDRYARGKRVFREVLGPSAAHDDALFDAIERYFEDAPRQVDGHASEEPIFVLGMPRSGTTLVDRILSRHSRVSSAGELGHFGAALHRATRPPVRSLVDIIEHLPRDRMDWAALGRAYVDSTRPLTGHTPRFVDKMPHNFLYAGFIAQALPRARIVCLQRDPMDTCLSNFRQLFAPESPYHRYSFDLLDTGRYYLRYHRLMRMWRTRFPGRILEVRYERLVTHQRDTTAEILDFCGLAWENNCLSFERATGPVPTASAVQVRAGLNRDSLHRWRRYGAGLDPLRRLLAAGGVDVD